MRKTVFAFVLAAVFVISVSANWSSRFTYENPRSIIITHPNEASRVTTSSRMSILGACDPDFPLYINGVEVEPTVRGFFTVYPELKIGENVFLFVNGDNAQEIVIVRNHSEPSFPEPIIWMEVEQYAQVDYANVSRFADYDDDNKMMSPLVIGTVFKILGERGETYIIEDGSYVFKRSVFLLDYYPDELEVYEWEVSDSTATFRMNINALYNIEFHGNSATVTISEHDYEIELDDIIVGYEVEFKNNTMTIQFRHPPKQLSETRVLIDAGHGGFDPGAMGPPGEFGAMEKHFNLYVSEITRDYLLKQGVEVVFVREGDERIDIMDRIEFLNDVDISVCVHTNSAPLSHDFSKLSGPLMFYTLDMSLDASDMLIKHISSVTENEYHPPIKQNFAMARYTGAPSMLFEMGFLCNPDDYERLLDIEYLDKMGLALGESIMLYLEQVISSEGMIVLPTEEPVIDIIDEPEVLIVLQKPPELGELDLVVALPEQSNDNYIVFTFLAAFCIFIITMEPLSIKRFKRQEKKL